MGHPKGMTPPPPPPPGGGGGGGSNYRAKGDLAHFVLLSDSADKLIHPRVAAFVKPDVRLGLFSLGEFHRLAAPRLRDRSREVFDAEGDHVAQVALGADVGEVVRHGVTLVDAAFSVYFFFRLFSDLNHHPVVVAEVASAGATLCKRCEVVRLHLNHLADVCHCLGLSLAAREVHRTVRLAILHRDEGHAAELVYLDDLNVVLHGQTMVENSAVVNSFRYFFSLFFDGLEGAGWHRTC